MESVQDFPSKAPLALSTEATSLESLIHHRFAVDCEMPLEALELVFREHQVDFLALMRAGRVTGVCARVRLGSLLGSRYGFALYGKSPAHLAQVEHPLVFDRATPVRKILDLSMARRGDEFHEDAVLVDDDLGLLGLIPADALARLQTRLVGEQLGELQRQHEALHQSNLELFQTNHALRQTQGLYQGLFESNTLGVALLDVRGQIQAHNRRLAELLELGNEALTIPSLDGWMNERDRLQFRCLLSAHEREAPAAGPSTREFVLQVPGRGARLFRFSTGWIRETGQVCACLDDITEQRTLEKNMMRQEKQRLLDTLVGGIAHELNNKLTPVLGFADIIGFEASPLVKQYADLIGQSAREASHIIRQLLQLSKPDSGNPRRVDLGAIVEESLLMLKFQMREHGCEVQFALPSEPVVVRADPAQIKQVVINLALNALQAMDAVPLKTLTISVGRGSTGDAFFSVADSGMGIAPENLGRIFDPFFTTKGPDRGSGLGLSICFSIARQYGGDIAVDSQPGAGATFTVTLPAEWGGIEPVVSEPKRAAAPPVGSWKARILVAEDEEVVRRLLQEMLRASFGCQVDLASNGAEALALAQVGNYDLIISDIRMPVMAGTEFYLRLRELFPHLTRRFIFITGHPGEKSLQDEIARWNIPVLSKPFSVNRLLEICQPMLAMDEAPAVPA